MDADRTQVGRWVEGAVHGEGLCFGLVVARFNALVGERLLEGALATLRRYGVALADVTVVWVPGAFEVPLAAQRLARDGGVAAVVCLGAIVRGATPHFDHVAGPCASGIMQAMLTTGVPVIFGMLTCDTMEQALDRAGLKAGNKGSDAALAALEMAHVMRAIPERGVG